VRRRGWHKHIRDPVEEDQWTPDAIALIEKHSARTIQVTSGDRGSLDFKEPLIEAMDVLEKAA
jgi:hypothetical protein